MQMVKQQLVELLAFVLLNISMNINKLGGHMIILLQWDRICGKDIFTGVFFIFIELQNLMALNI